MVDQTSRTNPIQNVLDLFQGGATPPEGNPAATRTPDGGFDRFISGAEAKPEIDRGLADVAGAAYDPNRREASGWTRVPDQELASKGVDVGLLERDGMRAGVYTNGQGNYVVAYAGNTGEDVPSVIAQSAGADTKQAQNAVDLAHQVERAYGGDNVAFTGHSMGGALAGIAAAATDSTSVVFNSQGVNDNSLSRLGLDPAATRASMAESSRAYGVDGDWATAIQNDIPLLNGLPDALGSDLRMQNPEGIGNLVNAHNLGPIIASFDQGLPIRSASAQPQLFEGPAQNMYDTIVGGLARFLPFRI